MSEYDLKQVKADLETIQAAAGIGEGPVGRDVAGNLLIAFAGALMAGWAMLASGLWQMCGFAAVLLPAGYLIALRVRHRKPGGGSPQVRQEFLAAGAVLSLAIPFVGYALWAQWMGIAPMLALATAIFFVGALLWNGVIARHGRPALAPWCLALMVGALAVPSVALSPVCVIGLMLAAGGLGSAAVAWIQMRRVADELAG